MLDHGPHEEPDIERPSDGRHRPSPVTLLVVFVLVIGLGYFLAVKMREMGRIQDCVMSGRSNCAPVSEGK